jgi:hypothetical protein
MARINLRRMMQNHRRKAPASVHFTQQPDGKDHLRPCVFVTCTRSSQRVGPTWGHSDASLRRALATLTAECECRASYHRGMEFTGHRLVAG